MSLLRCYQRGRVLQSIRLLLTWDFTLQAHLARAVQQIQPFPAVHPEM